MQKISVELNLNEIGVLIYVLTTRAELGKYAESAGTKLRRAERLLKNQAKRVCDVCEMGPPVFFNKAFLGSDDALCHECFMLWYDEGITERAEIKRRRLEQCRSLSETVN